MGWPHLILLVALYIAYSIVPAVTFVLAVVDMDMEKEKSSVRSAVRPGYRAAPVGASSAVPARVYRPVASQTTQAQPLAPANGPTPGPGSPARSPPGG